LIKDFSKVCKPITETLKGNPKEFLGGREREEGFEEWKRRFTTAPILWNFYPGRTTVVETEASDFHARMRTIPIARQTASPGGVPFSKTE